MTIWGIADLHLSQARPDPRERFAARWKDHAEQIARHWRETVHPDDVVLVPGDISMARNHRDVQPDLEWLERLPGTKVLAAGNHDRWWNGVERVRPLLRKSHRAVGGDAIALNGLIVCGTRGCPVLDDGAPTEDLTNQEKELAQLDLALERGQALRRDGGPLFVLWHYPPFNAHGRPGPCVERLEKVGATACVYGHLHAQSQWGMVAQGVVNGVRYHCVAADAIGFRPLRLMSMGKGDAITATS